MKKISTIAFTVFGILFFIGSFSDATAGASFTCESIFNSTNSPISQSSAPLKNSRQFRNLFVSLLADGDIHLPEKDVIQIIGMLDEKNGQLRSDRLEDVLGTLWLTNRYPGLLTRWNSDIGFRRSLKNRFEKEAFAKDAVDILSDLELIRDPSRLQRYSRNLGRKLLSASLFVVSWRFSWAAAGIAATESIDAHSFSSHLRVRKSTIETIDKYGFDAGYSDLKRDLSLGNKFDLYWRQVRQVYVALRLFAVVVIAVEQPHMISLPLESLFSTEASVARAEDKILETPQSEREFRQGLFDGWREAFKALNGRYPDPVRDKADWDGNWKADFESSIRELKLN